MNPSWLRCVLTLSCAACTVCSCAEPEAEAPPSESIIYEGAGPYPAIAEADFLAQLGQARSGLLAKCCDYISRNASRTDLGPPAPSAASRAAYDPAAGAACIGQYHALACPHGKEPPHVPASCSAAYRAGELQIGEACTTDWECQQDAEHLVCAASLTSKGLTRSCEPAGQALPRAGELCHPADSDALRCEPPLHCRDDSRCALPKLGESCMVSAVYGDTCDKGSVCDRAGSQRCVEPKPVGSACESLDECEMYACIDGVCAQPVWGLSSCTVH